RELEYVRDEYSKIPMYDGANAIVGMLIANITREKMIAADIRHLESPESEAEALDGELARCHDAIDKKKKSESRSR
ncbi:MAG TPA: hypothetical protein VNA25_05875, partial [Phycisphaerae bacterium]|nr:hypothetical protein [Phycisphaerae bacterium]